jgi:molybdopterin synthase sulfur carrier subunit
MARISLSSHLKPYTDGETEIRLDVGNVRQLFEALGERYPALQPYLDTSVAVAIDGEIYQDALLQPIKSDSDVMIITKIAGG